MLGPVGYLESHFEAVGEIDHEPPRCVVVCVASRSLYDISSIREALFGRHCEAESAAR